MKNLFTTLLATIFIVSANAQVLQQINTQFLTNGIVDATGQDLYTYKNISTNTIPPATNFEIKKLNTTTNQFDMVHSFPNPLSFVNHYVLAVINKKFLVHGDYKGPNSFSISGSNLFVYNGISQYDSLFVLSDSITAVNNSFHVDPTTQKIYFLVYGKSSVAGVYESDFTKAGTTRLIATPPTNYNSFQMAGLGNKLFCIVKTINAQFQTKSYFIKYENGTQTIIDSLGDLYNDIYKDEINNEIYVVATNMLDKVVRKVNSAGIVSTVTTITTPIGRMFGKIGNNLLFTASTNNGVGVLNLSNNTISTIYATGTSNQPMGFTSIFDVAQTPSKNFIYLKSNDPNTSLNKIWVTDGITITKVDSSIYSANNAYVGVAKNFCGDDMISMDYVAYNNIGVVTTKPTGATSKQCVVSSVPNWSCVTTGQYTTKTNLYIAASDNLYTSNCGTSLGIHDMQNLSAFKIYPNPSATSITIEGNFRELAIYNITGELVKNISANNGKTDVTISDLAKGLYFVKSKNGSVIKFVKE